MKFFLTFVGIALFSALVSVTLVRHKVRRQLARVVMDLREAAVWDATDGQSGMVNISVIDGCTPDPDIAASYRSQLFGNAALADDIVSLCPIAIRAALRFYGGPAGPGGVYGCGQARRALALYGPLDDDLSRGVIAHCAQKDGERR